MFLLIKQFFYETYGFFPSRIKEDLIKLLTNIEKAFSYGDTRELILNASHLIELLVKKYFATKEQIKSTEKTNLKFIIDRLQAINSRYSGIANVLYYSVYNYIRNKKMAHHTNTKLKEWDAYIVYTNIAWAISELVYIESGKEDFSKKVIERMLYPLVYKRMLFIVGEKIAVNDLRLIENKRLLILTTIYYYNNTNEKGELVTEKILYSLLCPNYVKSRQNIHYHIKKLMEEGAVIITENEGIAITRIGLNKIYEVIGSDKQG